MKQYKWYIDDTLLQMLTLSRWLYIHFTIYTVNCDLRCATIGEAIKLTQVIYRVGVIMVLICENPIYSEQKCFIFADGLSLV